MEVLACQEQYFPFPVLLSYKVIGLTSEPWMVVLKTISVSSFCSAPTQRTNPRSLLQGGTALNLHLGNSWGWNWLWALPAESFQPTFSEAACVPSAAGPSLCPWGLIHQLPAGSCCVMGKQAWKPGPEWGRGGGPKGFHWNLLLPALPPNCAGKEQHGDSPSAENLKQTNKKNHSISIFSLKIAVYKFSSGPRRSLVKVSGMGLKARREDHLLLALWSVHSTSVWSSGRNWANPLEIGKGVVMFLER